MSWRSGSAGRAAATPPGGIRLGPFELDRGVRRCGSDGRLLIGGSPLRLLRLSAAGSELLDRLGGGAVVDATPGVRRLIERLVDGGILHPCPVPRGGVVASDVTIVVPVRDHATELERLLGTWNAPVRVRRIW